VIFFTFRVAGVLSETFPRIFYDISSVEPLAFKNSQVII
jgi:hypothetical protein